MTVQVIKVPDIGEGIAEVELVAWHVKPGDAVKEEQALADVMTDKATVEIPSPVTGRVVGLGGEVGQVLAVGSELIRIERDGAAAAPTARVSEAAAAAAAALAEAAAPSVSTPLSPLSREAGPASVAPSAKEERAKEAGGSGVSAALRGRPLASPAVRALAWELGVDLNDVPPSGPSGRITRADLEAHAARGGHRAPSPPEADTARSAERAPSPPQADAARVQRAAAPPPVAARPAQSAGPTREVKIIGLRRIIAQRMQESKRRIPHYTYVEEIDVTEMEALRAELNAKWSAQRGHLTLLPFLVRAIVRAVPEFPQTNARFDDETGVLTQFDAVHIGVATQTDAGLMVPVLRDAQARDLWSCAAEIARLAAASRGGTAVRDELSGSTITITSLGRLGGIVSTPVINHPEVAIVGVNKIVTRPVFVGSNVVARQLMNLSCSFDHRVIDGALGAGFVQCMRNLLERPATLFIE